MPIDLCIDGEGCDSQGCVYTRETCPRAHMPVLDCQPYQRDTWIEERFKRRKDELYHQLVAMQREYHERTEPILRELADILSREPPMDTGDIPPRNLVEMED